jgi:hypothetical protein
MMHQYSAIYSQVPGFPTFNLGCARRALSAGGGGTPLMYYSRTPDFLGQPGKTWEQSRCSLLVLGLTTPRFIFLTWE